MSTLKVTHLQNENGTGPAMSIAVGGGVTFAGITTFHSAVKFPGGIEDGLQVSTGATISGSTNTITASTNGSERLRITSDGNIGINDTDPNFKLDVNGDIGIREGNNLVWHDASGTAAFRIRAQSDNILRFERASGNEPNLTIDDGKIGIGSTQPERKLDVVDSGSSGAVVRSKVTTNNGGHLAYEALNSSGTSVFSVTHNGRINLSENIVFASGQGLDFSATADGSGTSSSELLDDYEEGSWSPQIIGWDGSYSISEGRYIKIGRQVHLIGEVVTDATTGTGTASWPGLANLPYVNSTSFSGVSGSQRHMGTGTILGDISPGGNNGQGFVTFDRYDNTSFFPNHISSSGAQNFQNTMVNNITTVDFGYRFNCTYYTD